MLVGEAGGKSGGREQGALPEDWGVQATLHMQQDRERECNVQVRLKAIKLAQACQTAHAVHVMFDSL
jgi:hypothetical protein